MYNVAANFSNNNNKEHKANNVLFMLSLSAILSHKFFLNLHFAFKPCLAFFLIQWDIHSYFYLISVAWSDFYIYLYKLLCDIYNKLIVVVGLKRSMKWMGV